MTQQYDLYGNPVAKKKREPQPVMSPESEAMLNAKPAPFLSPLYAMLDRIGLHFDDFALARFAESIKAVRDDYPVEWIEPLEQLIVSRGVTNPETVASYLIASSKRNLVPGEKPEATKQVEAARELTEAQWTALETAAQARDAVALNRATQHVAAVHEKGADEWPPQVFLCNENTHVERGCSLVELGIYKNRSVKVPTDTKDWARKYVTERTA